MLNKVEDIIKNAKNNTEVFKRSIKLKRAIKKAEDDLAGLLYELGCEKYNEYLNSSQADKNSSEDIYFLVDEKHSLIKSLRNELNILNGYIECSCGKLTSIDYDYCPFCGVKLLKYDYSEDETADK